MLTTGMRDHVTELATGLSGAGGVHTVVTGAIEGDRWTTRGCWTPISTPSCHTPPQHEMFGPAAVVVWADPADWPSLLDAVGGQLTATGHAQDDEAPGLMSWSTR